MGPVDDLGTGAVEMSLDDLAGRSGVSPRTIRFYQSAGVLPKPRKDGRDARYNTEHLDRLRLIALLQERGLKLEAVRSVLERGSRGPRSASDWLGVDAALRNPWVEDRPARLSLTDVHELLGTRPHRLVGELVDAGLLERASDGSFVIPSPALVDLSLRLLDAGVSIDVANRAARVLRRRLAKAADDLVELFESETGRSFAGRGTPREIAAALDALRPIALDAASLILAQEIERALRRLAAAGPRKPKRT
jgi:DNA-binding transcriptional MerR regulator